MSDTRHYVKSHVVGLQQVRVWQVGRDFSLMTGNSFFPVNIVPFHRQREKPFFKVVCKFYERAGIAVDPSGVRFCSGHAHKVRKSVTVERGL